MSGYKHGVYIGSFCRLSTAVKLLYRCILNYSLRMLIHSSQFVERVPDKPQIWSILAKNVTLPTKNDTNLEWHAKQLTCFAVISRCRTTASPRTCMHARHASAHRAIVNANSCNDHGTVHSVRAIGHGDRCSDNTTQYLTSVWCPAHPLHRL